MSGNSTDEGQFSGDDSSRIGTLPLTPLETPTVDTRAEYRFDVRGREEEKACTLFRKAQKQFTLNPLRYFYVPFSRAFSPYFLFTYVQSDGTRGEEELEISRSITPLSSCVKIERARKAVWKAREGKGKKMHKRGAKRPG